MKTKDIVIGLIVLVILITGVLVYKNRKKTPSIASPTPNYQSVENKFPSLKVPDNADRASLSAVNGGEGMGETFRTYENGVFNLTVIANLPTGNYQVWIEKGDSKILLGSLSSEKGGYILNFSSAKNYSDYAKVLVTSGGQNVLEGSF